MSIAAAPRIFAYACGGFAGCIVVTTDFFRVVERKSPRSVWQHISSNLGIIYATSILGFNSAISSFNKQTVLDAIGSRPHDMKTIMRDAGARAGARTAITFSLLNTITHMATNSSDLPVWFRIQMSIPIALLVLFTRLPTIGLFYIGGRMVGSAIGTRMLLQQSLGTGKFAEHLGNMYVRSPIAARVLVGSSAAFALAPSARHNDGSLWRFWSDDYDGTSFIRSFHYSTRKGLDKGSQSPRTEFPPFEFFLPRHPFIVHEDQDEDEEDHGDLPVPHIYPHRHSKSDSANSDNDDDDDGGGGVDI